MTPAELALALLLARTCAAEIGLKETSTVEECQLMWAVNYRNVQRKNEIRALKKGRKKGKIWTLRRQTEKFNSYWKKNEQSRKQRRKRPWIRHLQDDSTEPPGWRKKDGLWNNFVDKWLAYLVASKEFVKDPEATNSICPEAIDYGGPKEIPRMNNVELIKCLGGLRRHGGTAKQRYWRFKREYE